MSLTMARNVWKVWCLLLCQQSFKTRESEIIALTLTVYCYVEGPTRHVSETFWVDVDQACGLNNLLKN